MVRWLKNQKQRLGGSETNVPQRGNPVGLVAGSIQP
jgi:hypothetical protein